MDADATSDPPRHDARDALQQLAWHLRSATDLPPDPVAVQAAVAEVLLHTPHVSPDTWPAVLDGLARDLGLATTWRRTEGEALLDEVQPGLPVVAWTPDGWVVLERRRGVVTQRTFPGGPARPASKNLTPTTWALVEAALPADVLRDPSGTATPLRRLRGLLAAERRDLGALLVYAAASALLGLAVPVAVQVLVNTVAFGAFRQPVLALGFLLFAALGLAAALRVLQRVVVEMLQRRLFVRMSADLAARLPRTRAEAFDQANAPELVNRFFDVVNLQKSLGAMLLEGLGAALQGAVGLVLLALYHPALLAFDLLLVVAIALILRGGFERAQATALKESKRKYEVAGWLEEIAARPALTKLGGGPELALGRADRLALSWLDARADHFRAYLVQYGAVLLLQAAANTAVLAIGGWLVLEQQLTLGQLVAAELVVATVLLSVAKFAEKLEAAYDLLAAVDKLGHLVDLPLEPAGGGPVPGGGPASLSATDLSLDVGGVHFLSGATLVVPAGALGVVVGCGGGGTTALADVAFGLRSPTRGNVALDGTDLRELRLDALRHAVALVREDGVVSGTIADNVTYGREGLGIASARDALERVGLASVVLALPQGSATRLAPSGLPLTEEQRVRLAAARAIAGRPRVLVIDGLLDRLAPERAAALLASLHGDGRDWTTLVLTQDPALAKHADVAWNLEDGALRPFRGGDA